MWFWAYSPFFDILKISLHSNCALLSATYSNFKAHNNRKMNLYFFDIFYISFHTNRALLSTTFSNFKAGNVCFWEFFVFINFGIFTLFYRVCFSTFWTLNKCGFYFFSLGKRRIVRFLARIVHYYRVFFLLFWHIW